jgi:CcmD family protein
VPDQTVLLLVALLLAWVGLFAYLLYLGGRLNSLRRELDQLEEERKK